ncbi:MAG TPA: NAD(P)H-binding protein [Woeseiaceae bacterium]|nr:NAD(P)H-binding protein [Woeseiaceae bacterium]
MSPTDIEDPSAQGLILVLGATGKTGRRIAANLKAKGRPIREGSRSAYPSFDWNNEANWDNCLTGVESVYINYAPDLAIPGAADSIRAFVERAGQHGVRRLVLLSGRGEDEAQACERIVQDSGIDWTVVRASWFNQNFSEGAFTEMVQAGQIRLPAVDTPEPWVDADDIADVVVAALTERGHDSEIYEVTGPRLLTLAQIASEIATASGREVTYVPVLHDRFVSEIAASGAPKDVVWLLDYLFASVLDGRNAYLADGVQRALGRPPKDFSEYAQEGAKTGVWRAVA